MDNFFIKEKIALAHDSFTQLGGAERVAESLHKIFSPDTVYTLVLDKKFKDYFQNWNIKTTWLQVLYGIIPKFQYLLPLIPLAVSSIKIKKIDVVLSNSSGFIKNLKVPKNTLHIDYCHTPTRFLWIDKNYINQETPYLLRPLARLFLKWMRKWDYEGAQKVSYFIANSKEVKKRISEIYNRESKVVYPGINLDFWHPTKPKQDYFLIAGRLQAHKRNDLIIKIFSASGGNDPKMNLHVVGTGRQEKYLKSIAGQNVKFLGRISDEALRDEYSGALGYIFPQIEDFGLMPLEAAACGTATLGIALGGNLETIIPGETGELFNKYDMEEIRKIIQEWDLKKYDINKLKNHSDKFSQENFENNFVKEIRNILEYAYRG